LALGLLVAALQGFYVYTVVSEVLFVGWPVSASVYVAGKALGSKVE
jgi:hypothetical protein